MYKSRIKLELDLSRRGAELLMVILGKISGEYNGPRAVTNKILKALKCELGIASENNLVSQLEVYQEYEQTVEGSFHMKDWPESPDMADCKVTIK